MLKRWVPASLIPVAMVLALAGGAVLAFGGGDDQNQSDRLERAADILGIELTDLQAAHDQAKREIQDAKIARIVEQLVATHVIDQEEADSFNVWIAARPDSADEEMFARITSSLFGSSGAGMAKFKLHVAPRDKDHGLNDRMAEILGIDPQDLADALQDSAQELAAMDRLARLQAVIDELLGNGTITVTEADELRTWVDATPQWLLDLDISARMLPMFGLFSGELGSADWLKQLPFGGKGSPGKGEWGFGLEFIDPEGNFRFGPGKHEIPFDQDRMNELLERFGIQEFGGLEGLLERFRGYGSDMPFEEPVEPTVVPDTAAAAA